MMFSDEIFMEFDINLLKINQLSESEYDRTMINIQESYMNKYLDNDDREYYIESRLSEFGEKIKEFIQKIIDSIKEFFSKLFKSEKEEEKEIKDDEKKLQEAIEELKKDPNKQEIFKKNIQLYSDEKNIENLNEYIREMAKLERELTNLKFYFKNKSGKMGISTGEFVVECERLEREMDKLNDKYDKKLLEVNKDIIKLALNDAIRFNEKELKNVKLDMEAIEKKSIEVLNEFKKDSDGIEHPKQKNVIQKMSSSIGTMVRKYVKKHSEYKHKNIKLLLGILGVGAITALGVQYVVNPTVKNSLNQVPVIKKAGDAVTNKIAELQAAAQQAQQAQQQAATP